MEQAAERNIAGGQERMNVLFERKAAHEKHLYDGDSKRKLVD